VSLSASKLANEIVKLATDKQYPKDSYEAGKRWAHAYALYAADGRASGGIPPAPLTANEQVLAAALGSLWATCRDMGTDAQGMASALTIFWLSPPVVFGSGAVSAVAGTSALQSALPGVWSSNQGGKQSAEVCARKLAAVIDTFTHTVTVTLPGPIVGPIS